MPEVSLSLPAKWQRYTAGTPTLDRTGEELLGEWLSPDRRTTHELVTHGISESGPVEGSVPVFGIEVDAQRCERQAGCLGEALSYTSPEFAPIMGHNGIAIVRLEDRLTYVDEDNGKTYRVDQLSYGGWLDSMYFFAGVTRECEMGAAGCAGGSPRYTDVDLVPFNAKEKKGSRLASNDGPLHIAANNNAAEAAVLLLEADVDVNVRGNWGDTPLHHAAEKNAAEVAALLIERGADANAKNGRGSTQISKARRMDSREVLNILTNR